MKITLFIIVLCALFSSAASSKAADAKKPDHATAPAKPFQNVGPDRFDALRGDAKNVVLDVRTPKEFAAGRIKGAVNIDWNSTDFEKKAAALDKGKTYLVHCAGGVRSAKACDKLSQLGFKNLVNLEGGLNAWEKAGKAVEK